MVPGGSGGATILETILHVEKVFKNLFNKKKKLAYMTQVSDVALGLLLK
jgi:hypothetical protein